MIEGFFLSLGVVGTTDSWDLSPKSILGLSYVDLVAVLLSLVPFLLGFGLVLLSLHSGFFGQVLKPISLLQLLP